MFGVIIHFSVSLKSYESIKLTYSDFFNPRSRDCKFEKNILLSIYFLGNLSPILAVTIRFCSYWQQK